MSSKYSINGIFKDILTERNSVKLTTDGMGLIYDSSMELLQVAIQWTITSIL